MKKWIFAGIFVLAVVTGAVIYHGMQGSSIAKNAAELDWRVLGELDYVSGKAPDNLKVHDGKTVKIPGFMVPLEDNQRAVTEFLLVPSPQACIHVPPPPPNQMVYVKMKKGTQAAMGPIWVYGTFRLTTKTSMYGDASFEVEGDVVEPYQ
jgi:hypothetical protein